MELLDNLGSRAKIVSRLLAVVGPARKNDALLSMADTLEAQSAAILAANRQDVEAARAAGMSPSMVDRLSLS